MNTSDISDLSYHQLHELRVAVTDRMKEMRETGIAQLRATVAEQANLLGVNLEELFAKKRRRKRKIKSENGPDNAH